MALMVSAPVHPTSRRAAASDGPLQEVLSPVLDDVVTPKALDLLARGDALLARAGTEDETAARFVTAHLAALRVGAALLAVRGRPAGRRRAGALNTWVELARVAPELHDWAEVFSRAAPLRAAVDAGRPEEVTPAVAARHLELAAGFAAQVRAVLGVPLSGGAAGAPAGRGVERAADVVVGPADVPSGPPRSGSVSAPSAPAPSGPARSGSAVRAARVPERGRRAS